ncbi:MAG TPA: PAS domain S-box protein [Microvirga sp.]|nr:PAS domain S-box protein [Microvirga sp.]
MNSKNLREALDVLTDQKSGQPEEGAFLQAILDSAIDYAIITTDLEGLITSWNTGASNVLGWTEAEACGQPLHIIFTPEDRALGIPAQEMRNALTKGRGADERWHLRKDGTRFWGQGEVLPLKAPDGKIFGFLKILRNRTEQRLASETMERTTEALQASEERFRAAVQAVDGILWTNTPQGEMRGEQPGWEALTGQSYEDYQGYGWAQVIHPDDREATITAWKEAVEAKKLFTFEHRVLCRGGEWRLFSIRAIPALGPDGTIREWVGVHTDITARKMAEDALTRETERLKIINRVGTRLASELDLDKLVQEATDAGAALIGAQFGAFFYNVLDKQGESYMLYALTGASHEDFAKFGMPRNTPIFAPTFNGECIVRSDDITKDPRYGHNSPHQGMPEGHLPVRSYLAVPVVSRSGEILGGLFFGHEQAGVFTEEHEHLLTGIASQAAVAIDNARLFQASQSEIAQRKRAEQMVQDRNRRLELLAEAIERAPSAHSLDDLLEIVGEAARRLSNADGVAIVLREGDQCFYAAETSTEPLWKGQRFPMFSCISGWAMHHRTTQVVPDVRLDSRLPQELYEQTFIKSLVMVPLLSDGEATAAIGAYWSEVRTPSANEIATLEALARAAGSVLRKIQAEQALRALNENLEVLVAERTADRDRMWRLSTDVMLVARFDGTITAINPAWTTLFGWREDELVGTRFLDLVHPDDIESTLAEVEKLSRGITTMRFENRYRHKDGSYRWLSWIAVPDEAFIHAVGRDVTAEKDAAEALRQAEEALRQAQKMEAVGQLTGGIAHDFNNLLTGIVGSLDMLQNRIAQGRTDNVERYVKAAMTSANRAAALTHRLLAFARRQPLDPKPVDANKLVKSMEDLLRRTLGETIELQVTPDDELWLTLCDPNQLESSILNLAINARDAMPDGGKLIIETANTNLDAAYTARHQSVAPGEYICISVTDTGIGMTPDVMARAFDPFFTTKPIGQGTGLGLSMIYGFAQQSEGHAHIYSELGTGTTVKLYLPRYRGEAEEETVSAVPAKVPRAETGETVLVVEDEPVVRGLIIDVLKDLGYIALEAADGPSALRILQSRQRIDLLVTDVGLPGLNGRQVADHARERRPDLKILFITGYAENAAVAQGFLEPGMEMITKPFAVDVLTSRIRKMIEP